MAHTHDVYDMENHFEINGSSRFIKETSETKLVVVQGDHKSEVLTFKMPRYIDGHDMTLCNKIRIHYINLDTKTNNKSADVYEVTDLTLCEECEDVLTFTWVIEAQATKYSGTLSFLVKFECTEGENVLYQWNTAKYVSVNVLAGIDNSEEFVEKYSNVLEEWYNELTKGADSIEELNQQALAEIELAKEDAKEDIQGKANSTMAAMEKFSTNTYNSFNDNVDAKNDAMTQHANNTFETFNDNVNKKAAETLENIPDDYQELAKDVSDLFELHDYIYKDEVLHNGINTFAVDIDANESIPIMIELFNNSTSDGYIYISGFTNENTKKATNDVTHLLQGQTSFLFNIEKKHGIDTFRIDNRNNLSNITVSIYKAFKEKTEDTISYVENFSKLVFGKKATVKLGFIGQDGKVNSSDTFEYAEVNGITKGDTICFSGGYSGWCPLFAYNNDGVAIELLPAGLYQKKIITIEDENIKIVCGFSEISRGNVSLEVLPFNQSEEELKTTIIVDINGNGDFTNIQDAITYAKNNFDVQTIPITIIIKNGLYTVHPTNDYPYACIDKGANKISLIGETRDGVIIECCNTSEVQSKVLDIGGECSIENLTILCLKDDSYTSEVDLGHNCYCIHNDTGIGEVENHYYTTVKNCKLYSECHSPLGAGLHDKQTQRYVDCEFISNGIVSAGALYVHASVESYATDMCVEIENCTCISKDNELALSLPNVADTYGSLKYTDIQVTIRRTICTTNGNNITNVSKDTHALTESSALNNIESCNY